MASFHIFLGVAHYVFRVNIIDLPSVQKILWATTVFVTLVCSYYLLFLVYYLPLKLLVDKFRRCGTILLLQLMVALFSLGILSTFSFSNQVRRRAAVIIETSNLKWKIPEGFSVVVGVFEKFLASKTIILLPMFISPIMFFLQHY